MPKTTGNAAPLVRLQDVTKSFGAVHALKGVSFDLQPGEVHALLGENGAGKSTLIKILSGVNTLDEGTIEIDGRATTFASPAESRAAGLAVVYQELSLVDSLSVAANLFLGREPSGPGGLLRRRQIQREAKDFLDSYGIPLDPAATVGQLPFAYRQMTEICKALIGDVKILVLDEPTSALTSGEEEILFDAVRRVTARGVGVVYVTHRLKEVFEVSQRVTVLRDGHNVSTMDTADSDMKSLVAAIVGPGHQSLREATAAATGDEVDEPVTQTAPAAAEDILLRLDGVVADRLDGVDLDVRAGEIHGLAGMIGSGRTEILQTVFGLRKVRSGTVSLEGRPLRLRDPAQGIRHGIALAPEDRHVKGLVLDHTIERNLALPRLRLVSRWGWVGRGQSRRQSQAAMTALSVKAPTPSTLVKNLSGGNQQKVVFAKWYDPTPRVLMLDEPTVGVDVGAREEIYDVVRGAADQGTGVLVVSSDLVELLLLCDRISVVAAGRVVRTVERSELANEESLHHLIQTAQPRQKEAS